MRCREEGQGCLVLGKGRVMGYLGRECQGVPRGSQGCLSLGFLVCMPKPVGLSLYACKGIEHLSKTLGSSSQSISDL